MLFYCYLSQVYDVKLERIEASIVFLFDDFEKTYTELKSKGVNFIEEPKKMTWETYAKFVDTDRNEFLLKG